MFDELEPKYRMASLANTLNKWSHEYYILYQPTVDDYTYDKVFRELLELEKQYPEYIVPHSPTQRIGEKVISRQPKIKHEKKMLSLDNVFNHDELREWMEGLKLPSNTFFIVEPKIDGLAVSLIYENARLSKAVTRGDGFIGQDITEAVKTISDIPLELQDLKLHYLEVRGEIYLRKSEFERINRELAEAGEDTFKHPRNLAAGTIQLLDLSTIRSRRLSFIAYDLVEHRHLDEKYHPIFERRYNSQMKRLAWLRESGFNTAHQMYQTIRSFSHVLVWIQEIAFRKDNSDIPMDGCVIKVDSIPIQRKLGENNRSPNWAIAYKFPPKKYYTNLTEVIYQVGRTGRITPVGVINPINIDGVLVSRVTFHNLSFLAKQHLTYTDGIEVIRSGEVIPKFLKVIARDTNGVEIEIPKSCPSCGSEIITEGEISYCKNAHSCKDAIIGKLIYFASREGMNILNFGEEYIKFFFELGKLNTLSDFYRLDKATLMLHPEIKDKQSERLLKSIEDSKQVSRPKFISALSIPMVSTLRAKDIVDIVTLPDVETLSNYLNSLPGFGDVIKQEILTWYNNPINVSQMKELLTFIKFNDLDIVYNHDKPIKRTLAITGKFDIPRNELIRKLEGNGYKVLSSVSKGIDFLLAGEEGGSKLEKAKQLNIAIIHSDELNKLLI